MPKEALEKAIECKEKMIPELLKMLEYTKENLENIFNEKDENDNFDIYEEILREVADLKLKE